MKDEVILVKKLAAQLMLAQRREDDTLVLPDEILRAALDGAKPLSQEQATLLKSSPLTLRRLRQLSLEARSVGRGAAANDPLWSGSGGMLRAASSIDLSGPLQTDDAYWTLHIAGQQGAWRLILALAPDAPFASSLLAAHGGVRVLDGEGGVLLEGALDADGECEAAWAHAESPYEHLQRRGARFTVKPN